MPKQDFAEDDKEESKVGQADIIYLDVMTFTHDLVEDDTVIRFRELPRVLGQRVSLLVDMLKEIAGYKTIRAHVRCA